MKKLLALMLFIYHTGFSNTYYVSNTGSDAANGLTTGTAWQTISKVNGFTFAANDSVLFKCGDSWNERLIPSRSSLYFGSYSTGLKPIITGFVQASLGSPTANVYTATATGSVRFQNTVLIDGELGIKARYPNSTYITYTAGTINSLTTSLTGTPSYSGKEIVVRTAHFIIDVSKVSSQSTGTLNLSPDLTYAVNPSTFGGNGFFFQNDVSFLDSTSEWTYDTTANTLKVYSTTTPVVHYSNLDTLVWIRNKSNIIFNNITFSGANKTAFQLDTCSFITIQNCLLRHNGTNGITCKKTTNSFVLNDSILNTLNNAIWTTKNNTVPYVTDVSRSLTITGNYIKNTGIYAGMGLSNNNQYFAINIAADSSVINLNTILNSGYIPLMWNGKVSLIKNNYVNNFCFTKDDGGGIYTVRGVPNGTVYYAWSGGSVIRGNIILNGLRADAGINLAGSFNGGSAGIYLDDFSDSVTVDSNAVYNTTTYAFNLRTANHITAKYNTFIDSLANVYNFTGNQFQTGNLDFKHNTYYQKGATNYVAFTGSLAAYTYASDSNYVLKPIAASSVHKYVSTDYSLSGYATASGYDTHSIGMPTNATGAAGVLITNPTTQTLDVSIPSGTYIDVYGTLYTGEINLRPFGSALLFPSSLSLSKHYTAQ